MSRRAHRYHDARPWETRAPDDDDDDDERTRLDRLLGELPGDEEATRAHDERDELAGARTRIADLEARAAAAAAEMMAWTERDAERDRRDRAQREMALCVMAEAKRLTAERDELAARLEAQREECDAALAELAQAREVLRALDHAEGRCPLCGWRGHAPDCKLSAALAAKE